MVSHAVWKTWPSGLSYDKNLGLRPRFLSTESLGPCFSHGTGDHDQILHHTINITQYKMSAVSLFFVNGSRNLWSHCCLDQCCKRKNTYREWHRFIADYLGFCDRIGFWITWPLSGVLSTPLKTMESHTKITFLGSMILFSILGGSHIEFWVT